jgi:hypothetical protein
MKMIKSRIPALTLTFALACGALAILSPDWRTALQAQTYYGRRQAMQMIGSGTIGSSRFRHTFQLYCDASVGPNLLQVSLGRGDTFYLEALTRASCTDDPAIEPNPPTAGFDTYDGAGTGRFNGKPGATAEWTFTDAGEPGDEDFADIVITDPSGNVFSASGSLLRGNHQARGQ